jgi:hypothetical protein
MDRKGIPFGIYLVMRLLSFAKDTDSLSDLQRLHGLDPSHLDFLSRQQSQALQTRFLILPSPGEEASSGGVIVWTPMLEGRVIAVAIEHLEIFKAVGSLVELARIHTGGVPMVSISTGQVQE